jgi:hypothetical protein
MRLIYFVVFAFVFGFHFSCNYQEKNTQSKLQQKNDSLAVQYQFLLSQLSSDSSLMNIDKCIKFALNDSVREHWKSVRRSMFRNRNSFEKLKIDPEVIARINPCYAPIIFNIDRIHDRHYNWKDLFNENFDSTDYKSKRFVVADFNTKDAKGNCKGCEEQFPDIWSLPELKGFLQACLNDKVDVYDNTSVEIWLGKLSDDKKKTWAEVFPIWCNLRDHVESYRTEPLKKDPVIEVNGVKYCIGQRLCLCEIQSDTIIKVAQFVTSSKNSLASNSNQHDFDGQRRYYAPLNRLTTRYWDDHQVYDSLDKKRDEELGFCSQHVITYKRRVPLPNFMHITPDKDFPGANGFVNGIHEFAVGGQVPGKYMGAPVSLGCVRLHDYPSKFIRWWTPVNAKMFIYYEDSRYKQNP